MVSSSAVSWEVLNDQLSENLKVLSHSCIKLNNLIEKYSIFMTHSYLPALDSGQPLPESTDDENLIATQLAELKSDLSTVSNQVNHFKTLKQFTPDQEMQHKQASTYLTNMLN